MKNTQRKLLPILALGAASLGLSFSASASSINFTGGAGDLTFYYESATETWHTVFRSKGTGTTATGLDDSFVPYTGIVGHNSGDHNFSSLSVAMAGLTSTTVNGQSYFIYSASGSNIYSSGTADLGIRFRLRENEVAMESGSDSAADQFDNLRLTLNLTDSIFASPTARFVLFDTDEVLPEVDEIRYETAVIRNETTAENLSHDWDVWGHDHWHWGFSEIGEYSLVFDIEGIGGTYGGSAPTGQVTVNFVVPEPGMAAAVAGLVALLAVIGRRRMNRADNA